MRAFLQVYECAGMLKTSRSARCVPEHSSLVQVGDSWEGEEDDGGSDEIQLANDCQSSQTLRAAMTTATIQARIFSHRGFTNSPIFSLSLVNITSGNTAKLSCMLSTTWLRIRSFAVPLSPETAVTITAGMIAMARVMSRRSHGRSRILRKPSITTCPASVPVSVEFCPDARSARAKTVLAPVIP